MTTFTEFEERLAEALPGYESRPPQQRLAESVEKAIANGRHLLGQAGCGTGKSLGYAIPAILSGKRTVISTATKALQDQLALKDMPFLSEHLDFTFSVLKGRSNYICLNKAIDADVEYETRKLVEYAEERLGDPDFTGERSMFPFEVSDAEWRKIAGDTDDCQAIGCSGEGRKEQCFALVARKRAQSADVVIVNHALFITDLVVREMTQGAFNLIGEVEVVVFDEAHELEEFASSSIGASFTEGVVFGMTAELRNMVRRYWSNRNDEAEAVISNSLGAMTRLWQALPTDPKGSTVRIHKSHIEEAQEEWFSFYSSLVDIHEFVSTLDVDLVTPGEIRKAQKSKSRIQRRALQAAQRFAQVITASFDDLVRWIETSKKTYRGVTEERKVINYAPISVGDYLRPWLFSRPADTPCGKCGQTGVWIGEDGQERDCNRCHGSGVVVPVQPTCILVSATMGGENGTFIAGRLGVDVYDWIDVGTPFDFSQQAVLYVPVHLPEPSGQKRQQWESMSIAEMARLVNMSQGRALLLFTSTKQMRDAYNALTSVLPYRCIMQGQRPNAVLAEEFKNETETVLFATRSFFTGVDFVGETLSLVIIDKLPFGVPTEPMTEARCEAIKKRGGNDFTEYTVPMMTLVLQQGFGRLIRHRDDTGVVAILDPRLFSKPYGQKIVRALPDARQAKTMDEVTEFFA